MSRRSRRSSISIKLVGWKHPLESRRIKMGLNPPRPSGRLLLLAGVFAGCCSPLHAQVTSIVVGITPTCPYGYPGCYPGAREALSELPGVKSVSSVPDVYNCTAEVMLKHEGLPAIASWPENFKKRVGNTH